jgi:hypothetical protein
MTNERLEQLLGMMNSQYSWTELKALHDRANTQSMSCIKDGKSFEESKISFILSEIGDVDDTRFDGLAALVIHETFSRSLIVMQRMIKYMRDDLRKAPYMPIENPEEKLKLGFYSDASTIKYPFMWTTDTDA